MSNGYQRSRHMREVMNLGAAIQAEQYVKKHGLQDEAAAFGMALICCLAVIGVVVGTIEYYKDKMESSETGAGKWGPEIGISSTVLFLCCLCCAVHFYNKYEESKDKKNTEERVGLVPKV